MCMYLMCIHTHMHTCVVVSVSVSKVFRTNTGKPYYQNDYTKETRWDPPAANPSPPPAPAYTPPPLPEWWEAMQDAQGKTYYVNHKTQKTQWERPTY